MTRAPLGLSIFVYTRGAGGVPTTTILDELSGQIESYQHTISARFGFESMTCTMTTDLETALDWLGSNLGASCVVYGPDAEVVWEGFLETVEATLAGERRSMSLRDMANRVRVRFSHVAYGTPFAAPTASTYLENAASIALYGRKDTILAISDASDVAEATDYGNTMLARLANPTSGPSSTIQTGESGGVQLTLSFAGWYAALDWVVTSDTTTTKSSTTTQVGTLLTAYNAVNNFFSTSTANIVSSGVTATEYIEPDTAYRQKIEALLARGNGSYPYAWGVYEDRAFYADQYAGATPTTIDYRTRLGDSSLYDDHEGVVQPWNARPDRMYEVAELLDIAPVAAAKDSAARFYVARVTFAIGADGHTLTLEPDESTDLAAVLFTKYV